MNLKEQKKHLLEKIDALLADAPDTKIERFVDKPSKYLSGERRLEWDRERRADYARDKETFGTVTIEIPGAATYTILNTRQALGAFRKLAEKFPGEPRPTKRAASPSRVRGRLCFDEVSYYTPFAPRNQKLIEGEKSTEGNRINIYTQGWFTEGHYAVKTARPNVPLLPRQLDIQSVVPKGSLDRGYVLSAFSTGSDVYAHVFSPQQGARVVPAAQVDVILSLYPEAEVYVSAKTSSALVFKVDDDPVGLVMPLTEPEKLLKPFAREARDVIDTYFFN